MSRTTYHHHHLQARRLSCLALLLIGLSIPVLANFASGVCNSPGALRLNAAQLQQVQASLRQKSGFAELGFDEQGTLTLGNRQHLAGGSATVRALLIAAVDGANRFELESHEHSPEVAFARLWAGGIYETADRQMDVYQLQLDFADFKWLAGTPEAKAAFDIGINVLHELTHGVLQLKDPQGAMDQLGECEAHVNQMRRELRLPERLYYHPDIRIVTIMNEGRVVRVLLQFVARQEPHTRLTATYQLSWLASQVSPQAKYVAALEKGTVGIKLR